MTNLMKRAMYLRNIQLFETSMTDAQRASFATNCACLSKEIIESWEKCSSTNELGIFDALYTLSFCIPPRNKSAKFIALEFRRKIKRVEYQTEDISSISQTLCESLMNNSTEKTEEEVLEAIDIITEVAEKAIAKAKIPKQKIKKIEPPEWYKYAF